jgi:rubrerythrin
MINESLRPFLNEYVRFWGPIDWSALRNRDPLPQNPAMGRMLLALAQIEGDSQVIRRKLATTHADRNDALLEFIAIWLAEEGEHSRALRHMASLLGTTSVDYDRRCAWRDIRAFVTWPTLYAARLIPGLSATYCAVGAIQEHIALTTYNHLAAMIDDSECQNVLKRLARQECRHMRFYRHAAEIFLAESRCAQLYTSALIKRLWRPAGKDFLGSRVFEDIFAPLLSQRKYTDALASVDGVISRLPGLGDVRVMSRWLNSPKVKRFQQ